MSMMGGQVADRLRLLKEQRGLTVLDMAERSGIPRRTFEKYLLKADPVLPGADALLAISTGLDISLDWLLAGEDYEDRIDALIRVSVHKALTDAIHNRAPETLPLTDGSDAELRDLVSEVSGNAAAIGVRMARLAPRRDTLRTAERVQQRMGHEDQGVP